MLKIILLACLTASVALLIGCSKGALSEISGVVTVVTDGDTIKIKRLSGRILTVRLAAIDAPEKSQSFGLQSKAQLRQLVLNKRVSVRVIELDHYGRSVGLVSVRGASVNLAMIESGAAWFYRDYAKWMKQPERMRFEKAEWLARSKKRGLWKEPRPLEPWNHRRLIKQ